MHWMPPESRLDSFQTSARRAMLATQDGRAYWLQGFAGTGKTVVLCDLARNLLTKPDAAPASIPSLCIITFTHALRGLLRSGLPAHLAHVLVLTVEEFRKDQRRFDWVLVDEVQDLSLDDLSMIRRRCGRMILTGDMEQTIYDVGAGAEAVAAVFSPTIDRLIVLHRLSSKVVRLASKVLPQSRIVEGALPTTFGVAPDPELRHAPTFGEEVRACWEHARALAEPTKPVAILIPDHKEIYHFVAEICAQQGLPDPPRPRKVRERQWARDYGPFNEFLEEHDLPLAYLGNGFGSLEEADSRARVFVMTYHSAKGLDFPAVILPLLTDRLQIWRDDPDREARLFFVAMTRSKRELVFSWHGDRKHPMLERLGEADLHVRSWTEEAAEGVDDGVFF